MIWYRSPECRGALPCGDVAAVAIRVRHCEGVVVARVAVSTGRSLARWRHLVRPR